MLVDNKTVMLKNCTLIGKFDKLQLDILEDCYIIPKINIKQITNKMQGVKLIETEAIY